MLDEILPCRQICKKSHSELVKPVSPQAAQLSIFVIKFHVIFIEIHFLEGPDIGHSTIYMTESLRGMEIRRKKA